MKSLRYLLVCSLLFITFASTLAYAGVYADSAHGDRTYGAKHINRPKHAVSNCMHCHSAAASEDPGQTGNICLGCHTDTDSQQKRGIINRSYSFRAGGWTADSLDSIREAFSFTRVSSPPGSSHGLEDILGFIADKWPDRYRESSNPCCACHHPHAAQGDPFHAPGSVKKSNKRGWPLTLAGKRKSKIAADILYGDNASSPNERMNNHTYQAPYRYKKTGLDQYEPDGTITTDGSNLTDFVAFCTECHTRSDDIISGNQNILTDNIGTGAKLVKIDWDIALHGKANGDKNNEKAPYEAKNYTLSCTDCHEPHGSTNLYLIRQEVNGAGNVALTENTRAAWDSLCARCHSSKLEGLYERGYRREDVRGNDTRNKSKLEASYCPEDDDGSKLCSGCHYHGLNF